MPARRILMLAPQPVLQPRGSPISVEHRLRALSALGYEVDLLTYPLGSPLDLPGLRIFRVPRPPGVRRIPIGPSVTKILLDVLMLQHARRLCRQFGYAAVHSHEEAALIGISCARRLAVPHVYDMHSSLPQQFRNWRKPYAPLAHVLFRHVERWSLCGSQLAICICDALAEHSRRIAPHVPVRMIENVESATEVDSRTVTRLRAQHDLEGARILAYVGNFEPYQGIELLLDGFAHVLRRIPEARLLLVGGEPPDVHRVRGLTIARGLNEAVVLTGTQSPQRAAAFLQMADVCVSPRISGSNVPLKLCTYMCSGRPLLATDLPVHTQILNENVALLVPPEATAVGDGLVRLLHEPDLAQRLAGAAERFARHRWNEDLYREAVGEAYRFLLASAPACAVSPALP